MNCLSGTHVSWLLARAIPLLPTTLFLVASCSNSTTSPRGTTGGSGSGSSGESGTGSTSGSVTGTGGSSTSSGVRSSSGTASSSGATSSGTTGFGSGATSSSSSSGTISGTASSGGMGTSTTSGGMDSGTVCVTSDDMGNCGPYLDLAISGSDGTDTIVGQNVWGPIPGYTQTLYSIGPGNWYVTANGPVGNTAVLTFPNVWQKNLPSPNKLSDYSSIYSSFSENTHPTAGTSAEAAFDIWLNNWNNEVMIQHDMYKRGGPCGPVLATVNFGGKGGVPVQSWILCQFNTEIIWQVSGTGDVYGFQSGSVDVLAMLTWLENNGGYLPQGSTLDNGISYGFEICSTGGVNENFEVTSFTITSSP
jgi:hypothetical protein